MTLGGFKYDPRDAPSARRQAETVQKVAAARGRNTAIRRNTIKKRKKARQRSFVERAKSAVGVAGQALTAIVTDPGGVSSTMGLPVGGIATKAGGVGARGVLNLLEGTGGQIAKRVAKVAGAAALGAAASEAVDYIQTLQGRTGTFEPEAARTGMMRLPVQTRQLQARPTGGTQMAMAPIGPLGPLSRGQEFPGGPFVVKSWDTYPGAGVTGGGAWPIFSLLSDGRIVVQKPNGSWKVYRPKKNLVISSNPRLRDIRKLDRMHKRVVKMMKSIVPRPPRRK